jgi:hypothetical protein
LIFFLGFRVWRERWELGGYPRNGWEVGEEDGQR